MIVANLQFTMNIQPLKKDTKERTTELESELSFPLVAITNESQWPEATGKLLIADAFRDDSETTWGLLANTLQYHFLTITNQSLEAPVRKLYQWELQYIHARFGMIEMILSSH